jgi:colicin import membrane protein
MGVLFLLLIIPWMKGCFRPKPKIITFIDLSAMPPPPEPAPIAEPESAPKPASKPKPVPNPPKTNAPPKVVKPEPKKAVPKPVVTNAPSKKTEPKKTVTPAPPKPKTLEERLAEVRQGGKPVVAPSPKASPQLDFSGLKSALGSVSAGSGTSSGTGAGSGGVYSPFAGYYDSVTRQMYSVWRQPAGAPIGLSAAALIRVERDGSVSVKSITRRSGNAQFDQSVQSALTATTRLPIPPANLPDRNISIEFSLD